jgi:feruloyl esterase
MPTVAEVNGPPKRIFHLQPENGISRLAFQGNIQKKSRGNAMVALSPLHCITGGVVLAAVLSSANYNARAQATDPCAALAGVALNGAKVESVQANNSGTVVDGRGTALSGLPGFCQVRGLATPTPRSRIHFEAWLPLTGWNGRIEMIGNGGYSSVINVGELATLVRQGTAAVATDTGHEGGELDFGYGNDEAIADWGYRAVHESIVSAKALAARFYGHIPRYSYFVGCSTGGHQALMEAQRYPEDFDGILAGDPGNNRTNLNFAFLWQFLANHEAGNNRHQILTAQDLALVNRAAVKQCDALDGVADGVIADPRQCKFTPAQLRCAAGQTTDCLSDRQVQALEQMYAGARRRDTGKAIYPGWPVGSETPEGAGGWQTYWANPARPEEPQRVDYFRHWVFNDPAWNWWSFDWAKGVDAARARMAPLVDAVSPDLSAFERHGSRIILYHGWADPVASATDTIAYYQRMAAATPHPANFSVLFLVPGMGHCSGGPGATDFSSGIDASSNIRLALQDWVEKGNKPVRILAVHRQTTAAKASFSRPLCPWPQLAHYNGRGDTTDAASFTCH